MTVQREFCPAQVLQVIAGLLKPTSGCVHVGGFHINEVSAETRARAGVCSIPEASGVFPNLTVLENLALAVPHGVLEAVRPRVCSAERTLAEELLADFNLTSHADTLAAELSFGQRKLLEFAATLMGRPRLVLLDEPAAGVNPVLVETIERHIRRLNADGLTFLVVEHDMPLIMRLCNPVIVLDRGRKIAEGSARQMQSDPRVLDAYLGA